MYTLLEPRFFIFFPLNGQQKASDITTQQIVEALPFDIPEDTRDAILKAMRKDKGDRTSSVALFASHLGVDIDFQAGEGSVTHLLNIGRDTTPIKIKQFQKASNLWRYCISRNRWRNMDY